MKDSSTYERLLERYQTGQVPWDAELPPPELMALLDALPPGRALDLGCGYGRACIYMARLGWQADGVDFVDLAVAGARARAEAAGVAGQIHFHQGMVTELGFLVDGRYDLVIDVGCMHALTEPEVFLYRNEVARLLKSTGTYLLFAHLRDGESDAPEELRWVSEETILAAFSDGFALTRLEKGWTQVEDRPAWRSAWFWFQRLAD